MKTPARWLLALTVVLGAALPAGAQVPPPPTILVIMEDGSGGCFIMGEAKLKLGSGVSFSNSDAQAHDVEQREGFWSFTVPGDGSRFVSIGAAGTYLATCDGGVDEVVARAKVKAPTKPSSPDFKVTWGSPDAANAWTYDVQYRIGTGDWRGWKRGVSVESATFDGRAGKTYFFRGRTTRAGGSTDWSPAKKVTT